MYCRVSNCRFPSTHTTKSHKCSSCHIFGHGIIECGNSFLIEQLKSINDEMPENLQCTFVGCNSHKYHSNEGHHCLKCYNRFHSIETCPTNTINDIPILCPLCRTINIMNKQQQPITNSEEVCAICMDKQVEIYFPTCKHTCVCYRCFQILNKDTEPFVNVFDSIRNEQILTEQSYNISLINDKLKDYPSYVIIYEGMGCVSFIRRLNSSSKLEGLFQHTDDGYDNLKMQKITKFITGYCCINDEEMIVHEWKGEMT